MVDVRRMAALGSSYAAGPGIEPVENAAAGRSARNYAHLLAERLGAELTDLTVSGATTATILDTPQRSVRGPQFRPHITGVPADADLITVTAGGNDVGYIGGLMGAATLAWLDERLITRPLGALLGRQPPPSPTEADFAAAAGGLARVVETARLWAPRARVVLVDYLTVIGPDTPAVPSTRLTPAQLAQFREIGERLAGAFADAATRTGADLVAVSALSVGHAVGSRDPWVCGYVHPLSPATFHPNAAGMRAVADAVFERLAGRR